MKIKLAVVALIASVAMCCSDSYGQELLNQMLDRGGCDPCAAASTCCDTPVSACGGGCGLKSRSGGCGLFQVPDVIAADAAIARHQVDKPVNVAVVAVF